MRRILDFNDLWDFVATDDDFSQQAIGADAESIILPHTWNAFDGQDGGDDYRRGKSWYQKRFASPQLTSGQRMWLRFKAANHVATVYLNGTEIAYHEGGFSAFTVDVTDHLKADQNLLAVKVDNGADLHVYPQAADFTFFGGLYRGVEAIITEASHVIPNYYGLDGVFITAKSDGTTDVLVHAVGEQIDVSIHDADSTVVASGSAAIVDQKAELTLRIDNPRLWRGRIDPYLYTAHINVDGQDAVTQRFGVRSFKVDPDSGFYLNGEHYPLRGVSRHQDRQDKGWAISYEDHVNDIDLIEEMGATSIRLAHYQHAKEFYDLCDERGQVVWAEIPLISVFDPSELAQENTKSQMRELVIQNYNHPSICFWGIANEVSVGGESAELEKSLRELNAIVKELDSTRLTTIANMSLTPLESAHNQITDIVGYNQYFGWYMGALDELGPWLDSYHEFNPSRPIAVTEYGAEGIIGLHSAEPRVKDYSEEYHSVYHKAMLDTFAQRPYLWATYQWNMFDFAADARDEGGCQGRNNKGLVTYDRLIRKDAYYIYKAFWSDEPFVHIAEKRFSDRSADSFKVVVFTNCGSVSLEVDGQPFGEVAGSKWCEFEGVGINPGRQVSVRAIGHAGASVSVDDTATFVGVAEPNPDYVLVEEDAGNDDGTVKNWFDSLLPENQEMRFVEGHYSIRDTLGELLANDECRDVIEKWMITPLREASTGSNSDAGDFLVKAAAISIETLWTFLAKRLPKHTDLLVNQQLSMIAKETS